MSCEKAFLQQLRMRGFRLTPQREIVLQVLHDMEGHVTAEEVLARVGALSSAVDLSTVYRTLELLVELGFVASVDLGDGQRRFELLTHVGPHHHLACRACGKLEHLDAAELQPLVEHLGLARGFAAQPQHLIISGLCRECREADAASVSLPEPDHHQHHHHHHH